MMGKVRLKYPISFVSGQEEVIGIIKHKVGEKVKEKFGFLHLMDMPMFDGTVVYIHPCGRYYTVEFDFDGCKIRESYLVRTDIYDYLNGGEKDAESTEPIAVNGSRKRKSSPRFR